MTNEDLPPTSERTDPQEGSPNYAWIVAQFSARWRVIESRDGLQWIVQHSRLNKGVMRWYGLYHLRTKACLLRYVGELEGLGEFTADPTALAALAGLPAWIESTGEKTKGTTEKMKAEVVAAQRPPRDTQTCPLRLIVKENL